MTPSLLEWGVASLALPGQTECGDRHVVCASPGGALAAALDGLGHGPEAAVAAQTAVRELETHSTESIISLIRRCHARLQQTRGAAISLASFDEREETMTWLGVGNVEGLLLRAAPIPGWPLSETLTLRAGIVGGQLPPLIASIVSVLPGDLLILATDGIRNGFSNGVNLRDPAQQIADQILAQFGKKTDDALVLVARYRGRRR